MKRIELSKKLLGLAKEIVEEYPNQSIILATVGGITAFFENEALDPLAEMALRYSKCGIEVVEKMENEGE